MNALSVKLGQLIITLLLVLPSQVLLAQQIDEKGSIEVLSARMVETPDAWQVSADIEIELSRTIRQGLDSGVPLHFIAEFRVTQPRNFWPDKVLIESAYRYTLIYYELTRHYRLQSISENQSNNYRSLIAALDHMGKVQGMRVERPKSVPSSGGMMGHFSLRLDGKALPLPLQPLFSSDWRLASEEFTWSLN